MTVFGRLLVLSLMLSLAACSNTPTDLAYGSAGRGTTIPPNATLVFDIGLLAVQ
jgi:hypothetical protein